MRVLRPEIPVHHWGIEKSPREPLKSIMTQREARQSRAESGQGQRPRVNRSEGFVPVIEICWVHETTYQILSRQKER